MKHLAETIPDFPVALRPLLRKRRTRKVSYLLSPISYLLSLICILHAPLSALAADSWTWRMPVKYYQQLDFEHRSAIDRARDAYIRAEESTRRNESATPSMALSAAFQMIRLDILAGRASQSRTTERLALVKRIFIKEYDL